MGVLNFTSSSIFKINTKIRRINIYLNVENVVRQLFYERRDS